ncbi:MAG TPA: protein kinase [Candidatus Acidoferrales bacterium]|nr:protein kinase [Candidatus Acidoferrales bacterium]
MSLAAGTRLGPYEILSPIGKGGMGHVYKARDTRLNRIVAIKVSTAQYTQRAEREARAVASLNHPHVCQLYDVGPNYLVMEFVEGERLHGPLPPQQAFEYACQILDALDAAHKNGIVHRDLKPSNILVTKSGVKLLDFGLAKLLPHSTAVDDVTLTQGLTGQGQILGSLHYMSPEQLQGSEADPRSDLFSFGLVFYEMLTGKRAYEGSSASLIADIIYKDPPGLSGLNKIAPPFETILKTCVAKDPNDRWQSARELKQVLEWAMASTTAPPPPPLPPRRRWLLTVLAAILAAGALGVWLGRTPRPPIQAVHYLTYSGRDASPSASPDGRSIAFASTRDGLSRIWLKELARGTEVPLTAGPDSLPRFSPDGAMILFTRYESGHGSLYRVPAVGGAARRVVDDALSGDWSPDGRKIVFLRQKTVNGTSSTVIGKADADGGAEQTILDSNTNFLLHDTPNWSPEVHVYLRWSPDGRTIAVTQGGLASATPSSILLLGADGSNPRTVAPARGGYYLSALAWLGTPDEVVYAQTQTIGPVAGGTRGIRHNLRNSEIHPVFAGTDITLVVDVLGNGRVVFDSVRPSQNVREVELHGKAGAMTERALTRGDSHDRQPTYSPSGDAVMFSSNRSGNLDLWEVSTRTGEVRHITDDPSNDWDPAYSPDGKSIAWSSNRGGHQEIWMARADGGSPRQVSNDGQDAENPVFLHDGRSILYVSWNSAKFGVWKIRTDGTDARLFIPGSTYVEVSPDGQYLASLFRTGAIRVFRASDGSDAGFEIKHGGRLRWMPDDHGIAFIDMNEKGVPGIFVQDFVPGKDTSQTRRPLGGFDPDRITETFGISPNGARLAISAKEDLTNLIVANDVEGITPPKRGR